MSWLLPIARGAWKYAAAAAAAAALLLSAWAKGRKSVRAEVQASTAGANRRMLDAAVQSPQEASHVVKDLRGGRF